MFSRTGSGDFPTYLKCMVTGAPKSGKTTLLGTVPNIVIADTEPHANNLQSLAHLNLPYVTINEMSDLQQLRMVLHNESLRKQAAEALGMEKIEAVAIDTLDTLQKIMKRERLRDTRQTQFLRDDWAWMKEEMTKLVEAFTALPMHVFFMVHTKTKEIGKGDDGRTIVLPGLEGSISEEIAGMVGYSLMSFRKQEIRPDGSPYTKYWLRAEGDETYEFLGNRAAGRLPDIIEPSFDAILKAAMSGRPDQQAAPVAMPKIETTAAPTAPAAPAQTSGQGAAPAEAPAAPAAEARPPADEPVSAAALQHMKKVYDACGLAFPEAKLQESMTIGEARTLVKMWQAVQQDAVEGKGGEPVPQMVEYLTNMGWVAEQAKAEAPAAVEPKVDGTIEQVMAYVGDSLEKVQEAFDLESAKDKPRSSLIEALEKKGAKPTQPTPEPAADVQTPVENQGAPTAETAVTSEAPTADVPPTEEQAVKTAEEALGGTVIGHEITDGAPCEKCGNPIDDVDLAQLGKSRFNQVLCVADYIAETKKPRSTV